MTTEASAVSEADTEGKQTASPTEPEPENKQSPDPEEGESSAPKAQEQTSEPARAEAATSPEEEQLKPRTRTSAGKGLSKLFSNFLKRRSQCSDVEDFEAEKVKEDKSDKEEKSEKAEVKQAEDKSEEKEATQPEPTTEEKEVKKEEKVEVKEEKKKEEEKSEKKGSKKKKKEPKKKVEEKAKTDDKVKKDEAKVKKEAESVKTEDAQEENVKKKDETLNIEDEKVKEKEEKDEATAEKPEEKAETIAEAKEAAASKDDPKGETKKVKEEVKIDKKEAKKKEKEEKEKKKEEERAKKREEEKVREAEKAKKKEQEKIKKKEAEEKAKEAKKKEEKVKEEKKKEDKVKEEKKKEEETKKKEEEKPKEEAKKTEEEELKQKSDETKEESVKKEEPAKKEDKSKEEVKKPVKNEQKTDKPNKPKTEEDRTKKKEKGKKGKKGSAVEQVKAPIADPEPELKTEPEIEPAPDQRSVGSAEQAQKENNKEEEGEEEKEADTEEVKEDAEEKESSPTDKEKESKGGKKSKTDTKKTTKDKITEEAKASKNRVKTMQCKVTLLDDALFECELDKHAKGQELFSKVCSHLNLMEKDYFGLAHWESTTSKTWIDPAKELRKQATGGNYEFTFSVKFYPPDPAQLSEDLTRYCLCLQLRKDIMRGVLPCSFVTLSLLGSYTAQSELGEYDPEIHGEDYVKDLSLAPGQTKELEEKVMELHRTYRSMSPAQADMLFLENAKKLAMYGVDLHQAKDLEGVDITLGVCSSGLMVYKDKLRINRFPWPKVLKISYKRSSFFIKIRASEQEQYESTIGFKLPNYKASKKLWKVCVEHHTFFRVSTVEPPSSRRFLVLGSKFRYSGRTQAQSRQASSMIDRPAPRFTRSASKRLSRNLDGVVVTQRGTRPVSAPVFSQAALAEAGIPMAPLDQPQTSTPIKGSRQDERRLEVTVEADEITKMETVAEDFDKPNEDLLKHHASISELKRNFMEAVPESRPSEWDKRLSTHSPFRTLGVNGQPLPGTDGPPLVQTQTVTITSEPSLSSGISTTEVPIVQTHSVTYESSKVTVDGTDEDKDGSESTSKSITSETTSGTTVTTTTTHISKVVKSGSTETRVEKRIIISADSDIEQEKGKGSGASAL